MAEQIWPFSPGDVPLEIWSEVFDLACLDGGFTARSLSLVSRHIRDVSEGHRYRTVQISSTSQVIALENRLLQSGPMGPATLKTRFISITLPINPLWGAYAEDTPGVWALSSESGDSDYQDSDPDWIGLYPSSEDDMSDSDGESLRVVDEQHSFEEEDLLAEATDLRRDNQKHPSEVMPQVAKSIEDLKHTAPSAGKFQYQVYGAVRRLLEAASKSLEVLSFYHYPLSLFQLEAVIPPLPHLRHLSIGFPPTGGHRYMGDPYPERYPSLKVLRLLGWPTWPLTIEWWRRIVESVPDSSRVTIISVIGIYRNLGYCKKKEGLHVWKFVKSDFDRASLPHLLERWWLEDVNGGTGIPSEDELDEKHGNGYQYESDDDL